LLLCRNGVFSAIVIALAFSFVPASFAVFIVLEREQNSKHLQMISGVGVWSYWLSSYLWDIISYTIPALIGGNNRGDRQRISRGGISRTDAKPSFVTALL
jgi:hypothetical protein